MAVHTCKSCGKPFEKNTPGRPPSMCTDCREKKPTDVPPAAKPNSIEVILREKLAANPFVVVPIQKTSEREQQATIVDRTANLDIQASSAADSRTEQHNSLESTISQRVLPENTALAGTLKEPASSFRVEVSNRGTVYTGPDKHRAQSVFKEYVSKSEQGYGQVGWEKVSLWQDSVILQSEHPQPEKRS